MAKFENIISKKKSEIIKEISNNAIDKDHKINYDYYLLLGIQKNIGTNESPLIEKNHNRSLAGSQNHDFDSASKNSAGKRDSIFSPGDLIFFKAFFEQRYFFHPNKKIVFLNNRFCQYKNKKLNLLYFNTQVDFSAVISNRGEIPTFLIYHSDHLISSESNRNDNCVESSNPQFYIRNFFKKIYESLNINALRSHFYNVFELHLKNQVCFLDGDFIEFNNQIMLKINLFGTAEFTIMTDENKSFLGIFSATDKESTKNEIVRIIKSGS